MIQLVDLQPGIIQAVILSGFLAAEPAAAPSSAKGSDAVQTAVSTEQEINVRLMIQLLEDARWWDGYRTTTSSEIIRKDKGMVETAPVCWW